MHDAGPRTPNAINAFVMFPLGDALLSMSVPLVR